MFFFVIIKNLNQGISTKNLLTFKRWDGAKDEKFQYNEGSLKNPKFRRGSRRTNIQGELPKKGAWTVYRFKRGLGKKRRRWCF